MAAAAAGAAAALALRVMCVDPERGERSEGEPGLEGYLVGEEGGVLRVLRVVQGQCCVVAVEVVPWVGGVEVGVDAVPWELGWVRLVA